MATIVDGTDGVTTPGLVNTAGETIATTLAVAGATTLASLAVTGTATAVNLRTNGIATNIYPVVSGTAVSPASGAAIDFSGIPSYAKRIIVMFNSVSTTGTPNIIVQVGVGTPTITGYLGSVANISTGSVAVSYTTGFGFTGGNSNVTIWHGAMQIYSVGSNTWVSSVSASQSNTPVGTCGGGSVTLSGTLNFLRITTVTASAFDAGSINIMWD